MKFRTDSGITAELLMPIDPMKAQPAVCFSVPCVPGHHIFNAASILDCAARGAGMTFPKSFDDEPDVFIQASEMKKLAKALRKKVTPVAGRFEVKWVGSDPAVPF